VQSIEEEQRKDEPLQLFHFSLSPLFGLVPKHKSLQLQVRYHFLYGLNGPHSLIIILKNTNKLYFLFSNLFIFLIKRKKSFNNT